MTTLRRESILVSTDWLAEHLGDETVRILDCRYYFDGRDGYAEYRAGHIPGARYFDWTRVTVDPDDPIAYRLASPEYIAARLGELGIGDEHTIVGYDDEGGHFVARLWLALARYGRADRLRILDGGWTRWLLEGRPVSTEEPQWPVARFTLPGPSPDPDLVADADDVLRAVTERSALVLDVRRLSEYTGEEVRARRGGHIPGARHWFWQQSLDWDGDRRFLPAERIAERLQAIGVAPETPVITYCHGGVRAAHAALALRLAGIRNVRVYVGSWAEWGNCDDLPIALGIPTPSS
ncbi:MAG: sulfurtransferase [Thermomicrobium sp.]|nr:sulfurtransferase [Thermomicrobium sp.]MDW8005147.1 sulfurtransferase [Thermomicrobium sp.]